MLLADTCFYIFHVLRGLRILCLLSNSNLQPQGDKAYYPTSRTVPNPVYSSCRVIGYMGWLTKRDSIISTKIYMWHRLVLSTSTSTSSRLHNWLPLLLITSVYLHSRSVLIRSADGMFDSNVVGTFGTSHDCITRLCCLPTARLEYIPYVQSKYIHPFAFVLAHLEIIVVWLGSTIYIHN